MAINKNGFLKVSPRCNNRTHVRDRGNQFRWKFPFGSSQECFSEKQGWGSGGINDRRME